MTFETLVNLIRAKPFSAFTLHLADGRTMRVAHPEFTGFVGDKRTLMVSFPGRSDYELVDLILINSVAVNKSKGEASRRRRAG